MDKNYDVFISYRRSDSSERAQLIREILKGKGYDEKRIFLDVHNIHEGEFPERIKSAINESKAFILLISNDSFHGDSKTIDYYYEEIKQALELKIKFIPVLFDGIKIETINLPKEIRGKRLSLKNAISYYPEYKEGFEDRLFSFLKPDKTHFGELFVIPTVILTIFVGVVFLCGLSVYIHDNVFLSREKQIAIVADNIGDKDGSYFYVLPTELITFDPRNDSIAHFEYGGTMPIINSQISSDQLYKVGFWGAIAPIGYGITKYKVKPHGERQVLVYVAVAVSVVAGFGLGFAFERMIFPIQLAKPIRKSLDDKNFWNDVLIWKYQSHNSI